MQGTAKTLQKALGMPAKVQLVPCYVVDKFPARELVLGPSTAIFRGFELFSSDDFSIIPCKIPCRQGILT